MIVYAVIEIEPYEQTLYHGYFRSIEDAEELRSRLETENVDSTYISFSIKEIYVE